MVIILPKAFWYGCLISVTSPPRGEGARLNYAGLIFRCEEGVDGLISIVLVEDHCLVQQGLKRTLESCQEFEVVGVGNNAEDGLYRIEQLKPDVAIIDLGLPDHSGLWLLRRIVKSSPETAVLILTMHDDAQVARVALDSGARGFLRKSAPEERLLEAVQKIHQKQQFLEPEMIEALHLCPPTGISERELNLPNDNIPTDKELELLSLLAAGKTNNQIAQGFGVSLSTIKARLRVIFDKLGVENRTEAVAEAHRRELFINDLGRTP